MPDFKLDYRVIITKPAWYWDKWSRRLNGGNMALMIDTDHRGQHLKNGHRPDQGERHTEHAECCLLIWGWREELVKRK